MLKGIMKNKWVLQKEEINSKPNNVMCLGVFPTYIVGGSGIGHSCIFAVNSVSKNDIGV